MAIPLFYYNTFLQFPYSIVGSGMAQKFQCCFLLQKLCNALHNNYGTIKQGRESVNLYGGVCWMSHYI